MPSNNNESNKSQKYQKQPLKQATLTGVKLHHPGSCLLHQDVIESLPLAALPYKETELMERLHIPSGVQREIALCDNI